MSPTPTADADAAPAAGPRRIGAAEVPRAAATLARALAADPGWIHIFPDDRIRRARMEKLIGAATEVIYEPRGEAWQIGDAAGVALWDPPGRHDLPLGMALRVAPRVLWHLGRRARAAGEVFAQMERRHPREPHWYLAFLGIDPAHQGRGLGPRLLAPVLDRADDAGLLAWLESTNPRNHAFYRRMGFEVADQHLVPAGPTITFFARRPR